MGAESFSVEQKPVGLNWASIREGNPPVLELVVGGKVLARTGVYEYSEDSAAGVRATGSGPFIPRSIGYEKRSKK